MNLSVIIIAKNSEDVIADCLKSVEFADEVIVIDDGSADATKEIAKKYGAKVVEKEKENFSQQRTYGKEIAKRDWVLYIDTDERVTPELRKTIQEAIAQKKTHVFFIQRKNYYLGHYEWPKIEKLERLFLKSSLHGWHGKLHETPMYAGSTSVLDGYLLHFTHRDLSSMVEKTVNWSDVEAQLRFQANHPYIVWWRFFRVFLTGFWDSFILQQGWRVGTAGLIESIYQGFSLFITYAKLWELQNS